MKATVTRKVNVEVEIKTVEIEIPMYEIEDHAPKLSPAVQSFGKSAGRRGPEGVWRIRVDIETGKIEGWPAGAGFVDLFCKPRDGGSYRLIGPGGSAGEEVVAAIEQNYVPNRLVPGEDGDYIGFNINADGVITNWPKHPDVSEFFRDGVPLGTLIRLAPVQMGP